MIHFKGMKYIYKSSSGFILISEFTLFHCYIHLIVLEIVGFFLDVFLELTHGKLA